MTREKTLDEMFDDLPTPTPEQLAQLNSLGDLMPEPENLGFSITDLKPTSTSLRRTTGTAETSDSSPVVEPVDKDVRMRPKAVEKSNGM